MTIFGLNSPEIFLLLIITLAILGTKRIEKALNLFSKLLKFLLSNESTFDKLDKKIEPIKDIDDSQDKEEDITKTVELTKEIEKEPIKVIDDSQDKEDKSEKRLKIANTEIKERSSIKTKKPKGTVKDQTIKKLKTKNSKSIVKDKNINKSKTIKGQVEQLDKKKTS